MKYEAMKKQRKQISSFTIPAPIKAALEKAAVEFDVSQSELVSSLIFNTLKNYIPKQKTQEFHPDLFEHIERLQRENQSHR